VMNTIAAASTRQHAEFKANMDHASLPPRPQRELLTPTHH
jgi:hypothetical protein